MDSATVFIVARQRWNMIELIASAWMDPTHEEASHSHSFPP